MDCRRSQERRKCFFTWTGPFTRTKERKTGFVLWPLARDVSFSFICKKIDVALHHWLRHGHYASNNNNNNNTYPKFPSSNNGITISPPALRLFSPVFFMRDWLKTKTSLSAALATPSDAPRWMFPGNPSAQRFWLSYSVELVLCRGRQTFVDFLHSWQLTCSVAMSHTMTLPSALQEYATFWL